MPTVINVLMKRIRDYLASRTRPQLLRSKREVARARNRAVCACTIKETDDGIPRASRTRQFFGDRAESDAMVDRLDSEIPH
ncbi:hypothetical protein QE152_g7742 [Popillia japonica]|uniref:Uncharacterized protein n=1 Tax=Popillia japonica TaxID=7064 RepID=A0AAW1MEL0_POPJA